MGPVTAYLGLGSNLGEREANLARAIQLLGEHLRLVRSSWVYETAPWGYTDQPLFLNCVVEVESTLSPRRLLGLVQRLEKEIGREPGLRYGPRLIDLDILLYGNLVVAQPDLQIPHPRLPQRAFVLLPLAELAGGLAHPVLNLTIAELAHRVEGKEGIKEWGPPLAGPLP